MTDSNGGSWMLGPPLLIGDRVFYTGDSGRVRVSGDNLAFIPGVVKWMGRIQECFGNQMIAGVALVSITESSDTFNSSFERLPRLQANNFPFDIPRNNSSLFERNTSIRIL